MTILQLEATPTARHLEYTVFDEIEAVLGNKFKDYLLPLLKIASCEDEETFFGYHAVSQKHRLFQDILRVTFEDALQVQLPENFYFLRIPNAKAWCLEKDNFFKTVDQRTYPADELKATVINFLSEIESNHNISISLQDLQPREYVQLENYFADYIKYQYLERWFRLAQKYRLPLHYTYSEPQPHQGLEKLLTIVLKRAPHLHSQQKVELKEWLINQLTVGFYTEKLFLKHISWSQQGAFYRNFLTFTFPFDDTNDPQQSLLVAMNVPLFGNCHTSGCFTPEIFLNNQSVLGGEKDLLPSLEIFFQEIGFASGVATKLWKKGEVFLEHAVQGCLLQFYDNSAAQGQACFAFVDHNAFLCFRHGLPVRDLMPSKYIAGEYLLDLKPKGRDLELRLVMHSSTTLNPFSSLRMIRRDFLPVATSKKLIKALKDELKKCHQNTRECKKYIKTLKKLWKVSSLDAKEG